MATSNTTTENGISTLFSDITLNNTNYVETLTKLTESLFTNTESVTLTLTDSSGNTTTLNLPTLFHQEEQLKALREDVNSLSGLSGTAYVKDEFGNTRKIMVAKKAVEPQRIVNLKTPSTFNRRNNWFFENFMSPLLYFTFDLTDLVEDDVNKVSVKRLILILDTQAKRTYFESQLEGRNDLEYDNLLVDLNRNQISYHVDDDTYELPPSVLEYSGTFGVLGHTDEVNADGITKRHYQFTNVTYSNNLLTQKNSMTLKVGDYLLLNDGTRYQVESLDVQNRDVVLKKVSGTSAIPIGDNVLEIESGIYNSKEIAINIGYDEKQIIFLSSINTEKNITSTRYSKGVCFNSNKLVFNNSNGESITFEEYYKKEVVDFGMMFLGLAKDKQIPTLYGVIPNAPDVKKDNFKVVQINSHIQQEALVENVKKLVADKQRLSNEIQKLDNEIFTNNQLLQANRGNASQVSNYNTILDDLVKRKTSKTLELSSVVSTLSSIYKDNSKEKITNKYRVRGFWDYPQAKTNARTGNQEVVQFIVSYRYLSKSGNPSDPSQVPYTDSQGNQIQGYFSNWVEFKTIERKRKYDANLGTFIWEVEDTSNPDVVNSNQIDIPISVGEILEFKIKSVSEAGYPSNPLVSPWSNSVQIEFPADLETSNADLYAILEESAREEERIAVTKQINSYGIDKHFRETRTDADGRYFGHTSNELDSGFQDDNGKTLSVYEYLTLLQNQIKGLQDSINKVTPTEIKQGVLKVYLEATYGTTSKTYDVNNGKTTVIAPPTYYSVVKSLEYSKRRGAIVKHTFNMVFENTGNGPLYFQSKYPGLAYETLPVIQDSNLVFRGTSLFDDDYKTNRLYSQVPVRYTNFRNYTDIKDYVSTFGFGERQSSQTCGQFIYSRFKDVTGVNSLYTLPTDVELYPTGLFPSSNQKNTRTYVWNAQYWNQSSGTKTLFNPTGGGVLDEFCVHLSHPSINDGKNRKMFSINNKSTTEKNTEMAHANGFQNEGSFGSIVPQLQKTIANSSQQPKLGFSDADRYLIGKNTVGAYFYMSPNIPSDIRVDGTDSQAVKKLEPGQKITVPVTYEYRMLDYFDENDTYLLANPTVIDISTNQKLGVVGGYSGTNVSRKDFSGVTYPRTLGFDVMVKDQGMFSFDVRVDSVYGSNYDTINTTSEGVSVGSSQFYNSNLNYDPSINSAIVFPSGTNITI